jgi:16S rRNA A1518/A1519 N6-dimethyltransferase RsmA/KsgA/DIM1 with predicted DNA glycosylase/AP lyase activity
MPKNHSERVRDHFAQEWGKYDSKISKAIPFYKESFDTLISILHTARINPKCILEIGVGTGNLTNRLLQEFPQTSLVGIDLVEGYIIQAKHKLSVFEDRMKLSVKDVECFWKYLNLAVFGGKR